MMKLSGPPVLARLEALFGDRTGIDLGRGLKTDALSRLAAQRAVQLGLPSIDDYVELLTGRDQSELEHLVNAATVGLTWFFRDGDQLAGLQQLMRAHGAARPMEIWVPACATGEDVYSLAMLARAAGCPVNLLGTDINSEFLELAGRATYSQWSCRHVPSEHAALLQPAANQQLAVTPGLRSGVRFLRHNLVDPPPAPLQAAAWDAILCRNVLIYFYPQHAASTIERLGRALAPDGWLLLGASEMANYQSPVLRLGMLAGRLALQRSAAPGVLVAAAPAAASPSAKPISSPSVPVVRVPAAPVIAPAPPKIAPTNTPPAARAPATDEAALLRRANERHAGGQLAEALQLYAEVLAADPLCVEARMFLGIVHFKTGNETSAAVALRAALFLEPDLWPASFYLALCCDKLGNKNEAVREYRRVAASVDRPLPVSPGMMAELEGWRDEVIDLSRQRAGLTTPSPRRRR
jgi:chemotaxis protein methyltransferase CheR